MAILQDNHLTNAIGSSGQTGPVSTFFNDKSAPEHKDPGTLARALFDNESFEGWSDLYAINTFSIFFVSTAFVDLLTKGNATGGGVTSSIVNITSMSGILKLAQRHVGLPFEATLRRTLTVPRSVSSHTIARKRPLRI